MVAAPKTTGLSATLLVTLLVGTPLLIAPPLVRGLAADAWVKYYAALDQLPHPTNISARALVKKTDIAIQYLAPLPQASAAAILALKIGQRAEQQNRDYEAALVIFRGVRASCALARESAFGGVGFAVVEARAAALEGSVTEAVSR